MILTAFLVIIVFYVIFDYLQCLLRLRQSKMSSRPFLPILGHTYYFIGSKFDLFNKILKLLHNVNSFGFFLGSSFLLLLYDEKNVSYLIETEKTNIIEKAWQYKFLKAFAGDAIFSVNGSRLKESKKVMIQAVNPSNMKIFLNSFSKNAKNLVKSLGKKVGQDEFNIQLELNFCIISVLLETIMGLDKSIMTKMEIIDFSQNFSKSLKYAINRALMVWLHPEIFFKMSRLHKLLKESGDIVKKVCNSLVHQRKMALEKQNMSSFNSRKECLSTVFIDEYFQSKKTDGTTFSEQEIEEDVISMIGAGFETTVASIGFALMLLAMNQNIQGKVYNEIERKSKEVQGEFTLKDLSDLVYLDQVICETWRLYPPVPAVGRNASREIRLDNGGIVRKGDSIWFPIFKIHRDPIVYPNPDEFNPDNFLPEKVKSRTQANFMPFGFGTRKCFGNVFAKNLIKVVLFHLLESFRFQTTKTASDFDLAFNIVLTNRFGFPVSIVPRNEIVADMSN